MEELFTPEETAAKLKVTMRTVVRWLQRGRLQGVKAGRKWRVRADAVETFLQASKDIGENARHTEGIC
jgi:excisionase family DNA binding protein